MGNVVILSYYIIHDNPYHLSIMVINTRYITIRHVVIRVYQY